MFSFGSRGAISSFCCQHSVSTISSLGPTWVCCALGKLYLAEMSYDGNACGSHLQFKQRTTNPTVDWRAPNTEAFNTTNKNMMYRFIGFGLLSVGHQFGRVACMVAQFYDLYLIWVEWNAVSFLEYSEVCFAPFVWTSGLWCRIVKPIHAESIAWTWRAPKEANSCYGKVAQGSLFGAGQTFELSSDSTTSSIL